jgi:hypothetical protein
MTDTSRTPVTVRWYTPEEGGRRSGPPAGPGRYTPTGRFSDQPLEDMFSVVLFLPDPDGATGELTPMFPENVPDFADRLARGGTLVMHEGRRAVGECEAARGRPDGS